MVDVTKPVGQAVELARGIVAQSRQLTGGKSVLDHAVERMNSISVNIRTTDALPVKQIVDSIAEFDPEGSQKLFTTMALSSEFNRAMREELSTADVTGRYLTIADDFEGIKTDIKNQITMAEVGHVGFFHKLKMRIKSSANGSVADRFSRIRTEFLASTADVREQLDRESQLLDGYRHFRIGMKEAEGVAIGIMQKAQAELMEVRDNLGVVSQGIEELSGNSHERIEMEIVREDLRRKLELREGQYQVAKDLAESLANSYETSEAIYARVHQTTVIKERVFQRSVVFFTANETAFTGLTTAITALKGLSNGVAALEAIAGSMDDGLDMLADAGKAVMEAGVRAGYGSLHDAEKIIKLTRSVNDYQVSLFKSIDQLRLDATAVSENIQISADKSRAEFSQLLINSTRVKALTEKPVSKAQVISASTAKAEDTPDDN